MYWIALSELLKVRSFEVPLVNPGTSRECPAERATCSTANGCNGCTPTACCTVSAIHGHRFTQEAPMDRETATRLVWERMYLKTGHASFVIRAARRAAWIPYAQRIHL
jgi:hypothetical protein